MDNSLVGMMLVASSLVFLMIPGIGIFYGGLVNSKSVLNTMFLSLSAIVISTLTWLFWGWSIAMGQPDLGGVIGNPIGGFLFRDSILEKSGLFVSAQSINLTYPRLFDASFILCVGILCVALIGGALAGRVKISTWMIFTFLWITFIFAPLAHMLWTPNGLLSPTGTFSRALGTHALDMGGSSLIGIAVATSALIIVLIGRRNKNAIKGAIKPHNLPLSFVGAFLFLFGGFGLAAGAAIRGGASPAYAWIITIIGMSGGSFAWLITERIKSGYFTIFGALSGMIAGFISICAGLNVLSPLWAFIVGLTAGVCACLGTRLRYRFGYEDTLDVIAVNGFSGIIGMIGVGLFGQGLGLFIGSGWMNIVAQILVILFVILVVGVLTGIIAVILEFTIGWFTSEIEEVIGIDIVNQGESAYDFGDSLSSILTKLK